MDFLFSLFDILWSILTWGPNFGVEVELALGPLAIALAGGLALGGANYALGGKERRHRRRQEGRLEALRSESMKGVNEQIQNVLGRASAIETDATAEDVYGQSIQALTDRVQAGQSGQTAQLSKSLAAGGGDLTGSMNAMLQKLTASSNRSIQDIMNDYNERVDRRNLQQRARQDDLILSALGTQQNQFAALSGAYEQAANRSIQKATADKQFLMDSIGTGANIGSMFLDSPAGG